MMRVFLQYSARSLKLITLSLLGYCIVFFSVWNIKYIQPSSPNVVSIDMDQPNFDRAPPQTQASVDAAIRLWKISIPRSSEWPKYEPSLSLSYRGLMKVGIHSKHEIIIGRAAFASWEVLAATIAHEVYHANQHNWFIVLVSPFVSSKVLSIIKSHYELAAYRHELDFFSYSIEARKDVEASIDGYKRDLKILCQHSLVC